MKTIKSIIVCLFELAVGILLLVSPVAFTTGIITAFGITLGIIGLYSAVKYFRSDAEEAMESQNLTKGLLCLLAGSFCVLKAEWFVITFPVLTLLYGLVIFVTGVAKIQWTVDSIRQKNKKWFLAALSALISIVCGIVLITSPFSSTAVLWMFTGISLIMEAIFDCVAFIFGGSERTDTENIESVEGEAVDE